MKHKINDFLMKKLNMDQAITACMATFLITIAFVIIWMTLIAGGFGNLVNTLKFAQVLSVVERVYIGESDTDAVSDLAYSAMIESLGDRWSNYMTREEYEQYKQVQSNQYSGVGITLRREDRGWYIVDVADNSPAAKAGIQPYTYLVEVNDVDVTEMETADISAMMREDPEHITVVTENMEGDRELFSLVMEVIYSNPVSYQMLEGDIGYIKLDNFDETCADRAKEAVVELIESGAHALIFDVRNNGGGFVNEMTELLDYLLPEGEIFVSVDRDGKETVTSSDKEFVDLPMAVLVNENSYSAAECFAAVLREYEAATVVGKQTTGKNRSQTNIVLVDGSAVHISSKRYLTSNRVDLTVQGGLTPDIIVELEENDSQLAAALELFH